MNASELAARIKARTWQEIAQSETDFKAVPRPVLEEVIDIATAAALSEMDDELGAELTASGDREVTGIGDEEILWEGRPFLSVATRYILTSERVRVDEGLLGKNRQDVELIRVQDIDHKQTLRERMVGVGDVILRSADADKPHLVLNNVRDPEEVHNLLWKAVREARRRHGLVFREEM